MPSIAPFSLPSVIAHRGASGSAPGNTMAAFRRAVELGARAIEFDVTVTGDGVAVVMHDFNVDRCTDGTGPVVLKSMAEAAALDAGAWFDPGFAGERIPTLEHVLDFVAAHDLAANLEIKPTLGWAEPTARAVATAVKRSRRGNKPFLVSSMSPTALECFAAMLPEIPRGLIVYAIPENWADLMARHDCISLHCYRDFVTAAQVKAIHDAGHLIHVFTVNSRAEAEALFAIGVDAVFSDFPERLFAEGNE